MKVLILGANGMLGKAVVKKCEAMGDDVTPRTRENYDITNYQAFNKDLIDTNPDVVINCAAFTDVDACETEIAKAMQVNGVAPTRLSSACQQYSFFLDKPLKFVHISTDYVFKGDREFYAWDDKMDPVNVYGISKQIGEEGIQGVCEDYLIVRTSWLFGDGKNFIESLWQKYKEGQREFRVVDDQIGKPTYTEHLAHYIYPSLSGKGKISHITNSGECSWYELAEFMFKAYNDVSVIPISSEEINRPARRPRRVVLNQTRNMAEAEVLIATWQKAVMEYMATME